MSENNMTNERELNWDDVISHDGIEFEVLEEGVYPFEVTKFERGRSKGSAKLPPCNMAILTICIDNRTVTKENLVLHSKLEWKLSQFFRSIGQKNHYEPLKMNWNVVTGARGYCKVIIDTYIGRDNRDHDINRIDKFLDPDDKDIQASKIQPEIQPAVTSQPQQKTWKSGNF